MTRVKEEHRGDAFCEKISTAICSEETARENPFQAEEIRIHGYSHLELTNKKGFTDVLFLLFQGDIPTPSQSELFERLLLSVINPGPRHNATRAAMNAAVSKTRSSHILPLALNVLSGEQTGSHAVFKSMKFLKANTDTSPKNVFAQLRNEHLKLEGDRHIAPGFGSTYGTEDIYTRKLADNLSSQCETGNFFLWSQKFVETIRIDNQGWLITGLFASCLLDLGFTPYQGELIYQIACAPGLAAHGAEKSDKPLTDMPFISESDYVIKTSS